MASTPVQRKQLIAKKHEQALLRRIFLIIFLSILVVVVIVMYAIPAMVKIADVWDTTRNANVPNSSGNDLEIPLQKPTFQALPYTATNSASFVLKGYSQAGTTVYVKINGRDSGNVVTDSSGQFTFAGLTLSEGDNTFSAYAKSTRGRKSDESDILNIKLDTRAPTLDVSSPNPNDTFSGDGGKFISVKGKTSEATQMYVNNAWVILNPDGTFDTKFQLQPGENTLTMFAEDDAGNKSVEVVRKVTYNP